VEATLPTVSPLKPRLFFPDRSMAFLDALLVHTRCLDQLVGAVLPAALPDQKRERVGPLSDEDKR
jgi:hypothetical protein